MNPIYDTATRLPLRRRAVDSAELLIRSRKMQARAALFAVGFVAGILLCWISGGVQ